MEPNSMPLFYTKLSLIKEAARTQRLSDNSSEWGQEILDRLYTDHPQLNDKQVELNWASQDDKTGNAVGSIVVEGKVSIPVFVKDRFAEPFDTFVYRGKAYRLSPHRLKEVLFNPSLFDGVISRKEDRSTPSDMLINRPLQVNHVMEGRNLYASLKKDKVRMKLLTKVAKQWGLNIAGSQPPGRAMLNAILSRAVQGDIDKFAAELEDKQVLANYLANGKKDLLDSILSIKVSTVKEHVDKLMGQIPIHVVQLTMLPGNEGFQMKMASDASFLPQEVTIPHSRFADTVKNLGVPDTGVALRKAASPFGLTVSLRDKNNPNRPPLFLHETKEAQEVTTFGHYRVRDEAGTDHDGWVIPHVFALDKSAMDKALFIGDDGQTRLMVDKVAGVVSPTEAKLSTDRPRIGDMGCICLEAHNSALALEPFKVASVESGADGAAIIRGFKLNGDKVAFHTSKRVADILPLPEHDGEYLVPFSAKFASLRTSSTEVRLLKNAHKLTKIAREEVGNGNTCLVRAYSKGKSFRLEGPGVEKMGGTGVEHSPADAVLTLTILGLSAAMAEAAIEKCAEIGEILLGDLREIKPFTEDVNREKIATTLQALASLPSLRQDTFKLASEIKDPETLDRILSLGFLNKANLGILVDHKDDLEATLGRLSEMLIAARFGADVDLPKDAIIQCRQLLDEIIAGLETLKSRLGQQTTMAELGGDVAA